MASFINVVFQVYRMRSTGYSVGSYDIAAAFSTIKHIVLLHTAQDEERQCVIRAHWWLSRSSTPISIHIYDIAAAFQIVQAYCATAQGTE